MPKRQQLDLQMSSKAIIATQRSTQLLKAAPSSTKHGFTMTKQQELLGSAKSQNTKSVSARQTSIKVVDSAAPSKSLLHIQSMVPAKFEQSSNRQRRDSINAGSEATDNDYFRGPELRPFASEEEDESQKRRQNKSLGIEDQTDIQILGSTESQKVIRPTNQSSLPEIKIYKE